MVDLNTNSIVASANIAVLKKALQTEEQLMASLLEGMSTTQSSLASGSSAAPSTPVTGVNTSTRPGGVDVYA